MQCGGFFCRFKENKTTKMHVCVKGDNVKKVECVFEAERACGGPEFLATRLNKEQIASRKVLSPL